MPCRFRVFGRGPFRACLACIALACPSALLSEEPADVPSEWRSVVGRGGGISQIEEVYEHPEMFDWGPGSTLNESDNTVVNGTAAAGGPATVETLRQTYENIQRQIADIDSRIERAAGNIRDKDARKAAIPAKIAAARQVMLRQIEEYRRLRDEYEVHIQGLVAQGYATRAPSLDTIMDDDPKNPVRYNIATAKLNAFKAARARADEQSAIVDKLSGELRNIPTERSKLEAELAALRRQKAVKQQELGLISRRAGLVDDDLGLSTSTHSTGGSGVDRVYFDSGTAVSPAPKGAGIDNVYVPPVKVPPRTKGFLDKIREAADRLSDYLQGE
ncbi:MAG: hypothetical protein JW909_07345 [Planctomycetes bacterium]|nr:hypothetical protein [Planctomycetota bacterium]